MNRKKDDILIHTLENGLKVVVKRSDSNVSYMGALVNSGSRDEPESKQGLAHFVEHTIFKGTPRRRSWHVSNRMESIGGELNAYTTKEETMIYVNSPAGYVARGMELISDLIINANFPKIEIEREKDVIIEEIHSYKDSPSDSVFDEFEENIYAGSGLAHNILGNVDSVKGLTAEDARFFLETKYYGENIVLYCVDPGEPERNLRKVEKFFSELRGRGLENNRVKPEALPVFDKSVKRDNHQANCIIGTTLFDRADPRRHAMFLLNNYLGGPCMNSRLNIEMRDRRGLVYTVDSNVALMSDTGLLLIYFGTDHNSVGRCKKLVSAEIDRLAQKTLSPATFAKVRDQYCGQLIVGGEHRESRAMALAKSLLYYNEIHDLEFTCEKIRSLTAEDFRMAAELVASNGLSMLCIE